MRSKNVLNMLMKNFVTIAIVTVILEPHRVHAVFWHRPGWRPHRRSRFSRVERSRRRRTPVHGVSDDVRHHHSRPDLWRGGRAHEVFCLGVVHHVVGPDRLPDRGALGILARRVALCLGRERLRRGLVVHINAGIAALALVFALGPRKSFGLEPNKAHSLPLTLLGTGILWFGWFGFNAGPALAADGIAVNAFVTTQIAASAGALGWMVAEWWKSGKPTTLGTASGAVAGLVAITPAAGYVTPMSAMAIGLAAGVICFFAVNLKFKFRYDDSLDVVGIHLVGGIIGSVLLGVFAQSAVNERVPDGLLLGGHRVLPQADSGGPGRSCSPSSPPTAWPGWSRPSPGSGSTRIRSTRV